MFRHGLPELEDFDGSEPVLLVIDDLMNETDESVANLFTKGSQHRNVSVVFLVQNLFHKNKHVRTISLNTHNMVLFKNRERKRKNTTVGSVWIPEVIWIMSTSILGHPVVFRAFGR